MSKRTLCIFGATDRMNYGDLLFPVILQKIFSQPNSPDLQVQTFGLIDSDLSVYGALPTRSLKQMYSSGALSDRSCIIIAGGETLPCDWTDAHYYLQGGFQMWESLIRRMGGRRTLNRALQMSYRSPSRMPFVITRKHVPRGVRVAYNAVGGANLAGKPEMKQYVRSVIQDVDFVSVRDRETFSLLTSEAGRETSERLQMHPDSAISLSAVFPEEQLLNHLSPEGQAVIGKFGVRQYFCLQVKESLGNLKVEAIAYEIEKVYKYLKLPTVLLPIGRAFGHSDHLLLQRVADQLKTPFILPTQNTLLDTAAIIAHAAVFAGTSLHGAITAISYGTPHFALGGKDVKVSAFLNTWDVACQRQVEPFENIFEAVNRLLATDSTLFQENKIRVVRDAAEGLTKLAQALDLPAPVFP